MTSSFPSPDTIVRAVLPNEIVVLVRENPASPSVVIGGYLWAGSIAERSEQAGLANLVSGMLMRGTAACTFSQINETLESAGAQLGFSSGVHTVGFGGKALAEDLDLLLEVLSDSLRTPTFPASELETLRGQIMTGLQRRAYDTRRMADLTFDSLLYPDHPYGRSVLGYERTVPSLTREDLSRYYQGHYAPQGMVLAVVGAVSGSEAVERVLARLGDWQAPEARPERGIPPGVTLEEMKVERVAVPGKTQSDLVLGWPGLTRTDPDFMKANLTNMVLGVFGQMGRLGERIREEQGLAYYCYSHLEASHGQGAWTAIAGVSPAHVQPAVDGILVEVRRMCLEQVPPEELADSQSYLTGSMPLRLETNEGVVSVLLDIERYGLGLDYLQRYPGLVNAVTVDDLHEMALRYLDPDRYALVIAGPQE